MWAASILCIYVYSMWAIFFRFFYGVFMWGNHVVMLSYMEWGWGWLLLYSTRSKVFPLTDEMRINARTKLYVGTHQPNWRTTLVGYNGDDKLNCMYVDIIIYRPRIVEYSAYATFIHCTWKLEHEMSNRWTQNYKFYDLRNKHRILKKKKRLVSQLCKLCIICFSREQWPVKISVNRLVST